MTLRRNEKYCPKEIESKESWSTMVIHVHMKILIKYKIK
jgi:hypothetical protein